jgi:hypothetical protein
LAGVIVFLFALSADRPAYAYLDPGTGSIVLQGILGGVVALTVTLKFYWHRIRSFFSRGSRGSRARDGAPSAK